MKASIVLPCCYNRDAVRCLPVLLSSINRDTDQYTHVRKHSPVLFDYPAVLVLLWRCVARCTSALPLMTLLTEVYSLAGFSVLLLA